MVIESERDTLQTQLRLKNSDNAASLALALSQQRGEPQLLELVMAAHFFVSLTSDKPMPKIDLKPTNGKVEEKELLADLPTFKMWKMSGTFHVKPDLHSYPFDTQDLTIELEDDSNGQDILRLRSDTGRR